ncbi:MAG: hypothetical protein WD768_13630 [Phycisphaeraceae bacterium]
MFITLSSVSNSERSYQLIKEIIMLRFFGFSRKPKLPSVSPAPKAEPPPPPARTLRSVPSPPGIHDFAVKTRIAKAVGKDGRYACGSVRALPSVHKGEVILQATDGHQAACVMTQGQMNSARLVPTAVLPSRQVAKPVGIRLSDGRWEATDGKVAGDNPPDIGFPTLIDVLPQVGKHPFFETKAQADQRKVHDPAPAMVVMLGIDLDLLRKSADALGTSKLTLFVPVPVKDPNQKPSEVHVNKPVAVCPASRSDTNGVAVVMPLTPEHGTSYYSKVRETVVAAEKRAAKQTKPVIRRAGL